MDRTSASSSSSRKPPLHATVTTCCARQSRAPVSGRRASATRRLAASVPEQVETTIVHGDYRLDNVIYDADGAVAAVVDWELCTLGDPRADLGLLMVYWTEPEDEGMALLRPATSEPGFPGRAALLDRYRARSGRDLSGIEFFVALGYWKLAIIAEGVLSRFRAGQYGEEAKQGADAFAPAVEKLAEAALENTGRLG